MTQLILASQSPRRREILENLGLSFHIVTADVDETCSETDPRRYVEELALRKGRAVLDRLAAEGKVDSSTIIIAADTVVAAEGKILGKPRDREDALHMLELLSGKTHQVISGIALLSLSHTAAASEVTGVRFSPLSRDEMDFYVSSDEPYDKAGGYAVQGLASLFIDGLEGDYFNVVGLPVRRLRDLLVAEFGIDLASLISGK